MGFSDWGLGRREVQIRRARRTAGTDFRVWV